MFRLYRFQRLVPCRASRQWTRAKSSAQWLSRQQKDLYTKKAKEDNYKSRAAYKLQQINTKYRIFRPGQTVVDLGFAPGSWSQVAVRHTRPTGRVIGVDLIPVQPPPGVTAIQGNFLNAGVQEQLRRVLANPSRGRWTPRDDSFGLKDKESTGAADVADAIQELKLDDPVENEEPDEDLIPKGENAVSANGEQSGEYYVDLVLSDMCGIWPQETGFWTNSINFPYRLANTSGIVARDHATSIDLCDAGLVFCIKYLKPKGIYVCKFYTGSEASALERRLKRVFRDVRRMKPDASRSDSREAYFVAKNKRRSVNVREVFEEEPEQ